MRRSASGGRFGAGAEGTVGTGRSVIGGGVGYDGDDLVGGEPGAASEVGELYEEGNADDGSAGVLHEFAHRAGGAAGGEKVVADEDPGPGPWGVGVGLQGVGTVLEVVGGGDGLPGELVRFAGEEEALLGPVGEGRAEDEAAGPGGGGQGGAAVGGGGGRGGGGVGCAGEEEALLGPVGEGRAEDEAAGLGGEDQVVAEVGGRGVEGVRGGVEGSAVLDQGSYVLVEDAGFREVRDGADAGPNGLQGVVLVCHP